MGMTPAKAFPWPTPYGQSPDSNVLMQAQAPPQAPQQTFAPLNPQPQQATPVTANTQPARLPYRGFGAAGQAGFGRGNIRALYD